VGPYVQQDAGAYGMPRQTGAPPPTLPAPTAGSQYGVPRSEYGAPAPQPLPLQPPLQPQLQPLPAQAPGPAPAPAYGDPGAQWGAPQAYPGAGAPADGGYPGPQALAAAHDDRGAGAGPYAGAPEGPYQRGATPPEEESFAPDACRTLYVDNLPGDATKRELAHIFRAFEGFQARSEPYLTLAGLLLLLSHVGPWPEGP
jgi:hypothetical protein